MTTTLTIVGIVAELILSYPQTDNTTIYHANFILNIPTHCVRLDSKQGFTKMQCSNESGLEFVAP